MFSELNQAAFRLGFYIFGVAAVLLVFLEPGTAEYVITQISLIIGALFLVIVIVVTWFTQRR